MRRFLTSTHLAPKWRIPFRAESEHFSTLLSPEGSSERQLSVPLTLAAWIINEEDSQKLSEKNPTTRRLPLKETFTSSAESLRFGNIGKTVRDANELKANYHQPYPSVHDRFWLVSAFTLVLAGRCNEKKCVRFFACLIRAFPEVGPWPRRVSSLGYNVNGLCSVMSSGLCQKVGVWCEYKI